MADAGEEEHNFFGNLVTWLTSRFVSVSLPARIRKIWEDLLTTLYVHSIPGEHFGREAVYIFVVGTVPAFLIGSTSAALLFGIVPGFIAGMGLMVAFSQCQKTRSRARRLKAGFILTLSDLMKEDIQSIFSKAMLPRWVVSSDLEKVDWLNHQLKKVWPYFNEAYSRMLMDSWEPFLDFYKPTLATSVNFQELTLGTVAPQFDGLRMLELVEKEISMDVDTRWYGNASCILTVGTIMGVSFPVQVQNIHLKAVFRVIFKPLVEELPGFGAITYSIRKKKKFEFKLKFVGGDTATVPGLSEKLHVSSSCGGEISSSWAPSNGRADEYVVVVMSNDFSALSILDWIQEAHKEMISTAVIDSLCWPMRVCIPVIPIPADGDYTRLQRHMCPRRNGQIFNTLPGVKTGAPLGILDIKLVQARDLRHSEKTPDPFAMLYIHATPGQIRKSTTIRRDGNPIWNEFFELEVEDLEDQKVVIVLLDEGASQEFQVLGYAQFYLQALVEEHITERWLRVFKNMECHSTINDTKYRGQVNIEFLYRSYDEREVLMQLALASGPSISTECREARSKALSARFSRKGQMWEMIRGVLTVVVMRAEDLLPTDFNGKSDPYVVLNMRKHKRSKKKTMVVHRNLNPVWQERFQFLVEDASQDMLMAKVWDHDTFGRDFLGSTATTLTRVLQEHSFDGIFKLVGVPCGRLYLRLEWNDRHTSLCSEDPINTPPSECNSVQ